MRKRIGIAAGCLAAGLLAVAGCSGSSGGSDGGGDAGLDGGLPAELPFALTRPAAGEAPSAAEIETFTRKITGFYAEVDFFRWCTWHAHGLHESYDPDMPPYGLWWQDTRAVKQGDTITFVHYGGADNLMIRTSKVLANAAAGYLASGDEAMRRLLIDYCRGTVALFEGLAYAGEDPPAPYVTARAIFTHNHSYTTADGRAVAVDYDPIKQEDYDWNAHTVPNPNNPTYGSIWVRNMRSKDDVPHMWRTVHVLLRVVEQTDDTEVRTAAERALEYLIGFAGDIVAQGYLIRTKEDGETYVPHEEDNPDAVKDLASFVAFEDFIPNAECNPKLTAALLSAGETLGNDCGNGISPSYEAAATTTHYFNYAIVRYFHLTAIEAALIRGEFRLAEQLLAGLVERVDAMLADEQERAEHREWDSDAAGFLLAAAACGLPLTGAEARLIQQRYAASADHYLQYAHWDLWHAAVPDGEYRYIPSRDAADTKHVRLPEMSYLLQYCWSPWRNPTGVELVDCEVVLDPARWGE
jgi:hypothetical protein